MKFVSKLHLLFDNFKTKTKRVKEVKHNLSSAYLFGFICTLGFFITWIGVKQKKQADVIIGILISVGAILIYFLDFY